MTSVQKHKIFGLQLCCIKRNCFSWRWSKYDFAYSRTMGWENETALGRQRYVAHSLNSSSEGNEHPRHYVQPFPDWDLVLGRSCQFKGTVLIRIWGIYCPVGFLCVWVLCCCIFPEGTNHLGFLDFCSLSQLTDYQNSSEGWALCWKCASSDLFFFVACLPLRRFTFHFPQWITVR